MDQARLQRWCARAEKLGADEAVPLDASAVVAAEWVRMKCLYGCDEPGVHATCPPNLPPVEITRRLLDEYESAILLHAGPISGEDRSDAESRRLNDAALALERELFLDGHHKAWTMGCGPCDLCDACSSGRDCPTPQKARPSMEGMGVDVFTTVRHAGLAIHVVRGEDDPYDFFALVVVD
jgi:predicted metal-binding protein